MCQERHVNYTGCEDTTSRVYGCAQQQASQGAIKDCPRYRCIESTKTGACQQCNNRLYAQLRRQSQADQESAMLQEGQRLGRTIRARETAYEADEAGDSDEADQMQTEQADEAAQRVQRERGRRASQTGQEADQAVQEADQAGQASQ